MTRRRARAEKTRSQILDAAEECFAAEGFERTRLDDVAGRVGVRRGAIFHYFPGKRELYEAVLTRIGDDLMERLRQAGADQETLPDRIEAALLAWIDFAGERPTFPRLILHLAAAASDTDRPIVERFASPFLKLLEQTYEEGERTGVIKPLIRNPLQLASTLVGASVFFLAAMPTLTPIRGFDPLRPEHFEAHRRDALAIVRRLIGIGEAD
ncbi:MAG: TetR/AcrR family transcriptional regulator [Myxococcota bacterium]